MKWLVACLISLPAFAEKPAYLIETKIFKNGALLSNPRISALEDQEAVIATAERDDDGTIRNSQKVTVIAKRLSENVIELNYKFDFVNGGKLSSFSTKVSLAPATEANAHLNRTYAITAKATVR